MSRSGVWAVLMIHLPGLTNSSEISSKKPAYLGLFEITSMIVREYLARHRVARSVLASIIS